MAEALELTILIARQEPHRLPRVAVRWLERYLRSASRRLRTWRSLYLRSSLVDEDRAEAVRVLRGLAGSF